MEKKIYISPNIELTIVNTAELMQTDHNSDPNSGTGSGAASDPSTPAAPPRSKVF